MKTKRNHVEFDGTHPGYVAHDGHLCYICICKHCGLPYNASRFEPFCTILCQRKHEADQRLERVLHPRVKRPPWPWQKV